MTMENEPWRSRERRATDGLDWSLPPETPPAAEVPVHPDTLAPGPPPPPPPMARRSGPGWTALLLAAAGAAVLGGLLSGIVVALLAPGSSSSSPRVADASTPITTSLTVQQTSAVIDIAAKARPGVVRIDSTTRTSTGVEQDVGSGVVLDTQGHIITNAHVVQNTQSLKVTMSDGTTKPAILVGEDYPFTDVAVLQVPPGNLSPIQPGDSTALKLGETVVAIGNPLAEFEGSVTVGVVSGLNRTRTLDDVLQDGLIQTDAAVNNGNSGGALLNLAGQLVGMPTAVLRETSGGLPVQGIAFALPTNRILPIVQRIIQDGASYPRPSIGADTRDLTPDVRQQLPRVTVSDGALVSAVDPNGPAGQAGIQAGDVITMFGGEVVNQDRPFLNVLETHQIGETVRVVLNRNGRIIETDVRLAKRV